MKNPLRAGSVTQKVLANGLILAGMTLLSQIGGIILLGCWLLFRYRIFRKRSRRWKAYLGTGLAYGAVTVLVVPMLALPFGRVPMPLFATREAPVAPRALLYCLLNRHYVRPEVRDTVIRSARELARKYPGSEVHYLDGGFPCGPVPPILPHLSHADGRKIDLSFCYHRNGTYTWSPSPIGYWVYEAPERGEPAPYRGRPSLFRWDLPMLQGVNRERELDEPRTRELIRILLRQPEAERMLLEIHLQQRLKVYHSKLRFQQLQAARHDDHIHFQVRR
jgi:hypothetical protein